MNITVFDKDLSNRVMSLVPRVSDPAGRDKAFLANLERGMRKLAIDSGVDLGSLRQDAVNTLLSTRDLEDVMAEVIRDLYAPLYSQEVMGISSAGVSAWADTYIQKRVTRSGLFDYVTDANMRWADVSMQEIPRKVYTTGGGYGYSWFELQQAKQGGAPLDTEKALAAREAALDTREIILMRGDGSLPSGGGLIRTGFINDPTVPVASIAGGVWSSKTPEQIIADVSTLMSTYRTNTRRKYMADTLLLPEVQFTQIESLRLTGVETTVRKWLLENIDGLKTIGVLPDLAGAGVGGLHRAVVYAKRDEVVRGVVPMPYGFVATDTVAMRIQVYGIERIAGCEVRRPMAMLYADGV